MTCSVWLAWFRRTYGGLDVTHWRPSFLSFFLLFCVVLLCFERACNPMDELNPFRAALAFWGIKYLELG